MNLKELIESSTKLRQEGLSLEKMLASLKAEGASIVDSLKVVRAVEGVELGKAKEIIDKSETWADLREVNDHLRSVAAQSLQASDLPDKGN